MRVSIVTISFNQAAFLEDAVNSVLSQNHRDIEYFVVDPGSVDGSRAILDRYRDRLAGLILEPDNGPADGLNKGFAQATGDVFAYLNSDDLLCAGAVREAVALLQRRRDVDVVAGNAFIIDQHGKMLRKAYSDPFSLRRYAHGACVTLQQSTFIRASAFRRVNGFNVANRISWDGELLVDLGLSGASFTRVNRFWSCFRLHPHSITSSKRLEELSVQQHRALFRKIRGRDKTRGDDIAARISRLERYCLNPRDVAERLMRGPIYGRHAQHA
jgi:glycosyltransferase involved in cell wall biosynthesis